MTTVPTRIPQKPRFGARLRTGHPLSKGLIVSWLLNEGGGSKAWDSSGHQNHGTLQSSPTWKVGPDGKCLDTTTSSGVALANAARFLTPSFTITFRIRGDSTLTTSMAVVGDGTTGQRYLFYLGGDASTIYLFTPDEANAWSGTYWRTDYWDTYTFIVTVGTTTTVVRNGVVLPDTGTNDNITAQTGLDYVGFGFDPNYDNMDMDAGFLQIHNRPLPLAAVQALHADPFQAWRAPKVVVKAPAAVGSNLAWKLAANRPSLAGVGGGLVA